MRFGVLGPLQVTAGDSDEPAGVPAPRMRALLAVLLWRANQPVPVDELAELVWDGTPPSRPPEAIRALVMRLRRQLDERAAARIVTRAPGYVIEVSGDELDASLFETLTRDAGQAVRVGRWTQAARIAADALGLWRGTPLADVSLQLLHNHWVPHLDQLHVRALGWRIEAELHEGRHEQLAPELRALTAHHPLIEDFHGQLMLALYRCGHRAEALAAYQRARRTLVDELGIEPGSELRRLHERILAGDTGLLSQPQSTSAPAHPSEAPRQLPADVRHFVGRAGELKALSELPARDGTEAGAVVISAIGGMAGIGKTSLAIHWAHRHAERFPDGQLYADLRGFDPTGTSVSPAEAVRRFLVALGVPAQRIPADPDDQAALYRTRLAGRRMLIVLDNVRDAGQIRPLLPGSPGCLVLVTSRDQLAELVALNGAIPLTLDLLTEQEARDLLARRLGSERLAAEEQAVDDLIQACARLPLALNIAAAHAAFQPARSLSQLVDGLRDVRRRLDTLTIGSGAADIRAVFSWSYRTLDSETARVFRLLGMHPGPDISLEAAASLTALDVDRTRRALQALKRAHLLTEHAPGRHSSHDLLRAYAAEQAHAHDAAAERHDALRRVCDFYLHTAHAAVRLADPRRPPIPLDPPASGTHPYQPPDVPTAMAWFEIEHPNLLAAQRAAQAHRWYPAVWQLAWNLTTFHVRRGLRHDALAVWRAAAEAAVHLADPAPRIRALRLLGAAHAALGRHQEAVGHLEQALALAEQHPDLAERAHTHRMLARACGQQGDDKQALHHATRALGLFRALGQPEWEADALNNVGWAAARLGHYDTARTHCHAALELQRRHGALAAEPATLDSLGFIEHHTGHHHLAIDHYQQALTLYRGSGNAFETASTLENLGHPHAALGRHEQARGVWRQALEMYRQQRRTEDATRLQQQLDTLGSRLSRHKERKRPGLTGLFMNCG